MSRGLLLRITLGVLIVCTLTASAFAQGRGRGLGRKSDVFVNRHDARDGRFDARGPNQNWKCGVFVNCHDARNGRVDGRGRRVSRIRFGNSGLAPRGARVGYRNRYNMNDNRGRYRSRSWRNR